MAVDDPQSFSNQVLSYIRDPVVGTMRKASGLFAALYVISPFDFDWIPILGWLDDLGVAGAVAWFLIRDIRKHARRPKQGTPVPDGPDAPRQ